MAGGAGRKDFVDGDVPVNYHPLRVTLTLRGGDWPNRAAGDELVAATLRDVTQARFGAARKCQNQIGFNLRITFWPYWLRADAAPVAEVPGGGACV